MIPSRSRLSAAVFATLMLVTVAVPAIAVGPGSAAEQAKPFIWPSVGKTSQPYGCTGFWAEPRHGSCAHFHAGIDISNIKGTPIRAAADGVVTHVGWDQWGTRNWMVILDHGGGVTTWYAHMRPEDIPGLTPGARVSQGDLVGYMDTTGNATGPHLHWSVLLDGGFTNPINYVDGGPAMRQKTELGVGGCPAPVVAVVPGARTAVVLEGAGEAAPAQACAA